MRLFQAISKSDLSQFGLVKLAKLGLDRSFDISSLLESNLESLKTHSGASAFVPPPLAPKTARGVETWIVSKVRVLTDGGIS